MIHFLQTTAAAIYIVATLALLVGGVEAIRRKGK